MVGMSWIPSMPHTLSDTRRLTTVTIWKRVCECNAFWLQSGVYQYGGMTEALKMIYRTEGVRGLCCGLVPTLFRDAPFSGLYFMFYTQTKCTVPYGEGRTESLWPFLSVLFNFFPVLSSLPDVSQSTVELSGHIITERLFRVSVWNLILFFLKIGSHQVTRMVRVHFETDNIMFIGMWSNIYHVKT